MNIGITGASGFIGQNLCALLQKEGFQVTPILHSDKHIPERLKEFPYQIADVTSIASLENAFRNVDVVIHLAALFNHPEKSFEDYMDVNVAGVRNVLSAAKNCGVKRVVHASTIGVAISGETPYSEASDYAPPEWDKYETSKCEGEKAALEFYRQHNYPIVVIRPAQVYGPGDLSKLKFYKMVKKGVIVNPGKTLKHLIYIEDLCRAFRSAIDSPRAVGKVIIIAGLQATALKDYTRIVAKHLNVPEPRIVIPAIPMLIFATLVEHVFGLMNKKPPIFRRSMDFFMKSVSFKTDNMTDILDFKPDTSVDEGVERTASWYRDNHLI